jgi:glycosyltransferase involved in cell wall biosynthesis
MFPHVVASWVSLFHKIPWVADFRDLVDQTDYGLRHRFRLLRLVLGERVLCAPADAFVVPSEKLRRKLAERHGAPVHVIPNGFDEDDYPRDVSVRTDCFSIAYFGILLYAFRDPKPLFAALDLLAESGRIDLAKVRVEFFGTPQKQVEPHVAGFRCAKSVIVRPRVGRAEMFREASRAAVLLNMQGAEAGGAVPSKLTEYLGARRPILNIPGDQGPIDDLIRETRAGRTAASAEQIAAILGEWYRRWELAGTVEWEADPEAVSRYTRRHQTGALARVLSSVAP